MREPLDLKTLRREATIDVRVLRGKEGVLSKDHIDARVEELISEEIAFLTLADSRYRSAS